MLNLVVRHEGVSAAGIRILPVPGLGRSVEDDWGRNRNAQMHGSAI